MRVVEPQNFKERNVAKKSRKIGEKQLALVCGVGLLVVAVVALYPRDEEAVVVEQPSSQAIQVEDVVQEVAVQAAEPNSIREFGDNEFKFFYDNLVQPNLTRVENPPTITGNDVADARIRKIAEDRGYRLRSSPTTELSGVDGHLVQAPVVAAWKQLQSSAAKNGYRMTIVSGYRSVENQRSLFLQRLAAAGGNAELIVKGEADAIVDKVLVTSSIPGYSKHHTGYTIDLLCAGYDFENFKNSPCNDWLIKDNYKAAKEAGFIPSYPPAADAQGPDPEAWEYVYVGTEFLYN
jgi:hypothetical protein